MRLKKLTINMFRNIPRSTIEFADNFNIFHGNNGQGKTNYLESIFFLATLKSFRNARQKEMISWHESASLLGCSIIDNKIEHELSVSFETSSRLLKVDAKSAVRVLDYCKMLSVVAFSPEEILMIKGSPEHRRRYLDRAIFSSDADYLKVYHDYFRVLKQRNQLLKQRNYNGLEAWTVQLVSTGARLVMERATYVAELSTAFATFYKNISGSDEDVRLCYHNSSYAQDVSLEDIRDEFLRKISITSRVERERCTTVVGPHRDDLEFLLNERLIKEHGSQGQQKSFIMALKMAEIEYLARKSGKMPILLLDDMTAELDSSRVGHLMDFLVNRNMQVFTTTTDPASVPIPAGRIFSSFLVENGRIV